MDISYLPVINELNINTDLYLNNEQKYRVLQSFLPKKIPYNKLIKSNTKKDDIKYKIIDYIKKYYECSTSTALDYYDIILKSPDMEYELYIIMGNSNVDHKEMNKIIKALKK